MKKICMTLAMLLCIANTMWSIDFTLKGNAISKVMVLKNAGGDVVTPTGSTGEGTSSVTYTFAEVAAGNYTIEGYSTSEKTLKVGELVLPLTADDNSKTIEVSAATIGCGNSGWVLGTDFTIENVKVTAVGGVVINSTMGGSTSANKATVLLYKGNTVVYDIVPSEAHKAEGYVSGQGSVTVTGATSSNNATVYKAAEYKVVVDEGISVDLAWKTGCPTSAGSGTHFVPLNHIVPTSVVKADGKTTYTFSLTDKYYYMYRLSAEGKRTQGGYFQFLIENPERVPSLNWTLADFGEATAKTINHDPTANGGVNVADIFLGLNEKGYISMNVNDERDVLAQRNWQLINTTTSNFFIEPDYHFTIVNENGVKDNSVITLAGNEVPGEPWARIKAVGEGTAIVLVSYDAIKTNFYGYANNAITTNPYVYGDEWSALWPENTGVFVVTVGKTAATITPNMLNAGDLNKNGSTYTRTAGPNVDAELDVFYYANETGYEYSFRPEGAVKVEIAYPTIGENAVSYSGFSETGVTKNGETGEYTVLLKHGSQIVRLTDASGNCSYQVLRAKKMSYEVINETRPGKQPQAGDQLKVQYTGLYHPCNKLSGIYNMAGAIVYDATKEEKEQILSSGVQYNFCGTPAAQAITIKVPRDYDAVAHPNMLFQDGYLRVFGFGSGYGAHRAIDKTIGASMNGTASQIKGYFGKLPDIKIEMAVAKKYGVTFDVNVEGAKVTLINSDGATVDKAEDGYYYGIEGTYTYSVEAEGYKRDMDNKFSFTETSPEKQTIHVNLAAIGATDWDGKTLTEPALADDVYQIGTGAELAWFAKKVNDGSNTIKAVLTNDIDLGSFNWTPIGKTTAATAFKGEFDGQNHTIKGLYINTTSSHAGLFGYAVANISSLTVEGVVTTTANYAGGIVAYFAGSSSSAWRTISNCVNQVKVSGKQYAGGITSYLNSYGAIEKCYNEITSDIEATITSQTAGHAAGIAGYVNNNTRIQDCYNLGNITAPTYVAGIAGYFGTTAIMENVYNLGNITMTTTTTTESYRRSGSIVAGNTTTAAFANVKNAFASKGYIFELNTTIVTEDKFLSGEVAYKLGKAFGQDLSYQTEPVIGGKKVAYDEANNTYYNINTSADFAVANFDDIVVPASGIYTPEDEEDETCYWNSGDYTFATYTDDWGTKYYYDFVVTNSTSSTFVSTADQYNSSCGGAKSGANYAVWYDNYNGTAPVMMPNEMQISGFYVSNTAWVEDAILNGDGLSTVPGGFADGDYLKLVITGYDIEEEEVGSVTYTLAECTGKTIKYVKDWRWVDLTGLGDKVISIKFSMTGTKKNDWGLTTPTYFCMDDFGGVAPATDAPMEEYTKSGINDINNNPAAAGNAQRFDILGRIIKGETKGLNIVRKADGSSEKVIIVK